MFTTTLLYAGLLPLAAAGLIALLSRQFRVSLQATWACSTAGGFVAGLVGLKSQAGLAVAARSFTQPREAADWLPIIVLLALGVSVLLFAAPPAHRRWTLALAAALTIAVPLRLLSGNVRLAGPWSAFDKFAYLVLLAATLGFVWLLLASGGDEQQSPARLVFLVIVAATTAAVLTLSGALVYGQTCGALAAALAGTSLIPFLTSWRARVSGRAVPVGGAFPGLTGAAGVITFSLGSLILLGHFFAELSVANAVLLFVSLAAAGTPLPAALLRRPVWQQLAVRIVACLLPLALAIAAAAK